MSVQAEPPKIRVRDHRPAFEAPSPGKTMVAVRDLNFFYGRVQALHNISIEILKP